MCALLCKGTAIDCTHVPQKNITVSGMIAVVTTCKQLSILPHNVHVYIQVRSKFSQRLWAEQHLQRGQITCTEPTQSRDKNQRHTQKKTKKQITVTQ